MASLVPKPEKIEVLMTSDGQLFQKLSEAEIHEVRIQFSAWFNEHRPKFEARSIQNVDSDAMLEWLVSNRHDLNEYVDAWVRARRV